MWIFPDHMSAVGENYSLESFFPSGYIIAYSLFLFSRLIILAAEPPLRRFARAERRREELCFDFTRDLLATYSHLTICHNVPQITAIWRACGSFQKLEHLQSKPQLLAHKAKLQETTSWSKRPISLVQPRWWAAGQGSEGDARTISQLLEGIASRRVPKHFYWNLRWREKLMPIFQFSTS